MRREWGVPGLLLGAVLFVACENPGPVVEPVRPQEVIDPDQPKTNQTDSGTVTSTQDAGVTTKTDAGTKVDAGVVVDAGTTDAGQPSDAGVEEEDAGTMVDAGTPDAGLPAINFPNSDGWTFYGPQHGLPAHIRGATTDEGGNLWVAGGRDGLFLLRPGATTFEQFTMADGLRPYGYMADGGEPPGDKYLDVITVTGGPAGTVFVGYAEKPAGPGKTQCEQNFDNATTRDPSIYKSGDADRVTLTSTGISVMHYDIFTGPGQNTVHYPEGREKICTIHQILWDKAMGIVWFGGNHGFVLGLANANISPTCNGAWSCSGVFEHIHPLVEGKDSNGTTVTLSGDYRGMALYPNHDVFVGADIRSTRFKWGTYGGTGASNAGSAYFAAQDPSEADTSNHFDIWPDNTPTPVAGASYTDAVFGVATNGDGTFWVGSSIHGLAHVSSSGAVLGYMKNELVSGSVSRVAADPSDGSIWAGARWGGGVSRIKGGQVIKYSLPVFGPDIANLPVSDVQASGTGSGRKMLVAFDGEGSKPGAVGVYAGQ